MDVLVESQEQYGPEPDGIGVLAPIYLLLCGAAAPTVVGAVYGYLGACAPYVVFYVFSMWLCGWSVGRIVLAGTQWARLNRPRDSVVLGLIGGAVAEYAGWVGWIFGITDHEVLAYHPLSILSIMRMVADEGAPWYVGNFQPRGAVLSVLWALEAIIIMGVAALTVALKTGVLATSKKKRH